MNKYDEILKEYKSMFPEDIEAIILTKEKYDEMLGIKDYENIILKDRIDKAIEYIRNNFADIDYMKARYNEHVINTHIAEIPITDIEKLLDILKGDNNE